MVLCVVKAFVISLKSPAASPLVFMFQSGAQMPQATCDTRQSWSQENRKLWKLHAETVNFA